MLHNIINDYNPLAKNNRGSTWLMTRRVATITLNPAYDLVGMCPSLVLAR